LYSTTIVPEAEPLFYCPATPGYGQETGKFSPTKTGSLIPTATESARAFKTAL